MEIEAARQDDGSRLASQEPAVGGWPHGAYRIGNGREDREVVEFLENVLPGFGLHFIGFRRE
jgi:hypothetical protein